MHQITAATDALFGIVVLKWDVSIKLMYAIDIVAGNETIVVNNNLNQGSKRFCEKNIRNNQKSLYCEFEVMFRDDLSRALSIHSDQIDIVFIKSAGKDSVFVTFRFIPPPNDSLDLYNTSWVDLKLQNLVEEVCL